MVTNKDHNQQMVAMLMIREVKELHENETLLPKTLSRLESQLSKRKEDDTDRDVVETGSHTHTGEHSSRMVGTVVEPVASVLGACGNCGKYPGSEDDNPQSLQHDSASTIVGRKFVTKVEAAEQHPPEKKHCFLCEDAPSNNGCPLCAFIQDQNEDIVINFATDIQKELEKAKYDTSDDDGSDKE